VARRTLERYVSRVRTALAALLLALVVPACGTGGAATPPRDGGARLDPPPATGFCGTSSGSACRADADCVAGGCSGQVCLAARDAGDVMTTCEWRDCYDAARFGVACGCVGGRCAWR
jgi:eight-cysteine-cluster-containing protein